MHVGGRPLSRAANVQQHKKTTARYRRDAWSAYLRYNFLPLGAVEVPLLSLARLADLGHREGSGVVSLHLYVPTLEVRMYETEQRWNKQTTFR